MNNTQELQALEVIELDTSDEIKEGSIAAMRSRSTLESDSAGAQPAPRYVTRGESLPDNQCAQKVIIDWLNCTFAAPALNVHEFLEILGHFLGCFLSGRDTGRGLHGFTNSVKLHAYVSGDLIDIGNLAFGGEFQRGKWFLQLTGKGCGIVKDWRTFQAWLEELEASISRVDIAADFLDGEYSLDDAVNLYQLGKFNGNGRPPKTSTAGDWLEKREGRTLYVGRPGNGKLLCVYEKGKQLGDLESNWVRFELRLGNRDRKIPTDILTSPEKYFAGAYPALQELIKHVEAQAIRTFQTEGNKTLGNLMHHLKRCYGKALHQAMQLKDIDITELVEEVRIVGIPRRLDPASVVAGLNWRTVSAEIRRYEKWHL